MVLEYLRSMSPQTTVCYHHVDTDLLDHADVELYPILSNFYNYFINSYEKTFKSNKLIINTIDTFVS